MKQKWKLARSLSHGVLPPQTKHTLFKVTQKNNSPNILFFFKMRSWAVHGLSQGGACHLCLWDKLLSGLWSCSQGSWATLSSQLQLGLHLVPVSVFACNSWCVFHDNPKALMFIRGNSTTKSVFWTALAQNVWSCPFLSNTVRRLTGGWVWPSESMGFVQCSSSWFRPCV